MHTINSLSFKFTLNKQKLITMIPKSNLLLALLVTVLCFSARAQNNNVIPVQVKEQFSNLTLSDSNGNKIKLPEKGKNTMLVFIRGKVKPDLWCPICHYQYLELSNAIKKSGINKTKNIDTYFILPYSNDSLSEWINAFPKSIETINGWKNPSAEKLEKEGVKLWKAYCDEFFPENFTVDPRNLNLDLPVLFDPDQSVSKGLYLFKEEWGGTKVPQNIPTVYIIGDDGKVKFKYHSQYTNDRPNADYLIDYIEKNF